MKKQFVRSLPNCRPHRSLFAVLSPSPTANARLLRSPPQRCSRLRVVVSRCRPSRSCRWPRACISRATSPTCEPIHQVSLPQQLPRPSTRSPSATARRRLKASHAGGARRLRMRRKRTKRFVLLVIVSVVLKKFATRFRLAKRAFTKSSGSALLHRR